MTPGWLRVVPNRFFALKAVEEDRIAFHLEVRQFDGDDRSAVRSVAR